MTYVEQVLEAIVWIVFIVPILIAFMRFWVR